MNFALNIKNWSEGGNSYVLKGNPQNRWVGFQESVLSKLKKKFGLNFNIVIWTSEDVEDDYYCIPFEDLDHLFNSERKTTGKFPNRWTAVIIDHKFLMHGNQNYSIDVSSHYAKKIGLRGHVEFQDDFYIENARAEVNIRIGQSKFRKGVLNNFGNKCAITGIREQDLLRASHIIPWSHKKEFRGDISNGICLYVELDSLFDNGYISFNDNLEILISSTTSKISDDLSHRLTSLKGKKLSDGKKSINRSFLSYHREKIFKK